MIDGEKGGCGSCGYTGGGEGDGGCCEGCDCK